jgi:hypothetical protein
MKSSRLLLLLFCFGALTNSYALGLSETNHGLYLAVASWHRVLSGDKSDPFISIEPFRFNDKLVWRPFCNTGRAELTYPGPPHLARISMTAPDGKAVAKTRLGETFGSEFDHARFEDTVHGWSVARVEADSPYDARGGGFTGPTLPAPADLFQMEKPGIYMLEIQMQMFRVVRVTNQWTKPLIRFSPIRLKVEKPAEANPGKNR